jgi:hypothetical protein
MSNSPKQLTLFDQPELYFDEQVRSTEIDGVMYWSVLDVFAHYGNKTNPTKAWMYVKDYLEKQGFSSSNYLLELQFPGERQRKTPVANLEGFMRIAQVTKFKHWEHLRVIMALAGAECIRNMAQHKRDNEIKRYEDANLGHLKEVERLRIRNHSIAVLASLKSLVTVTCEKPQWGRFFDAEYRALFNETASQLRLILNTTSIRDDLPSLQLSMLTTSEQLLILALEQSDRLTIDQIEDIIHDIVAPLGAHLRKVCDLLGVHPITNAKLLVERVQ